MNLHYSKKTDKGFVKLLDIHFETYNLTEDQAREILKLMKIYEDAYTLREALSNIWYGSTLAYVADLLIPAVSGFQGSEQWCDTCNPCVEEWQHDSGRWYIMTATHLWRAFTEGPFTGHFAHWLDKLVYPRPVKGTGEVELVLVDTNQVFCRFHEEPHPDSLDYEGYTTKWDDVGVYLEKDTEPEKEYRLAAEVVEDGQLQFESRAIGDIGGDSEPIEELVI